MSHPFEKLSPSQLKKLFWFSTLFALVLMALMNTVGAPLITDIAPLGIVSFEFAGSPRQVDAILTSWDHNARLHAAFSLGLDYLFMLAYSTAIGLACLKAAVVLRQRAWPMAQFGAPLAWGQWVAAILDALENLALTFILLSGSGSPWPELAKWCALFKFLLIFLGLVYAFYGLVVFWFARWTSKA